MLFHTALFAHDRISVEKNLHVGGGEDLGTDVASFHHNTATCPQLLLAGDHPLPHSGMNRHAGSGFGHVRLADALTDLAAIEQNPIAPEAGLELNAGIVRQMDESGLVVEGNIPLDCLERERTIHGPAFEIHVAEFARQTRGNGALSGSRWAVDGNDEFALRRYRHSGRY